MKKNCFITIKCAENHGILQAGFYVEYQKERFQGYALDFVGPAVHSVLCNIEVTETIT